MSTRDHDADGRITMEVTAGSDPPTQQFLIGLVRLRHPDEMTDDDRAKFRGVVDAYLGAPAPAPVVALAVPIIHRNGSGARNLRCQASEAYCALEAALVVMRQGTPNARDFYVDEGPTIPDARSAHDYVVQLVEGVQAAYLEFALAVQDE